MINPLTIDYRANQEAHSACFTLRNIQPGDEARLSEFFAQMSDLTRQFYAPHPLDQQMAASLCDKAALAKDVNRRLVLLDEQANVQGYFILQFDISHHEIQRYHGYQIPIVSNQAISYAPCLAEKWIGKGLGSVVFSNFLPFLRASKVDKVILMGGVQSRNIVAVNYYKKLGFVIVGGYQSDVENHDMLLRL